LKFFLIKLSLNAISTASFVKQGKTYENYMIDVKASNFKLYKRAIHIINLLSVSKDEKSAENSLLKSIYSTDDLTSICYNDYNMHIEFAKNESFVVSKAIIMNLTKCKYEETIKQLNSCSSVRICIENLIKMN
jgi:N-acetylmuramic acid 6-phosphate (MurNAc-6-P) etherase